MKIDRVTVIFPRPVIYEITWNNNEKNLNRGLPAINIFICFNRLFGNISSDKFQSITGYQKLAKVGPTIFIIQCFIKTIKKYFHRKPFTNFFFHAKTLITFVLRTQFLTLSRYIKD